MKSWNKVFYFISLLLIMGCESRSLLSVAEYNITQKDINIQIKIEKAYNENYSDTLGVIFKLIQKKWRNKISEDISIDITDEMLDREAKKIDGNTKAPEILKRIKKLFKGDREKYLDRFVKDVLITRLLQNKFHFDTTYQKVPYSKINKVSNKIKTGEEVDSTVRVFYPEKEKLKQYYTRYLNEGISEDKYSYFVVRGNEENLKVFLVEKNDYTEWFRGKALNYPITFQDKKLKKKMLERTKNSAFWQKTLK